MKQHPTRFHMIFAKTENGVIGNGDSIPFIVIGEQQIFKALTQFQLCIVGRKTYDVLPDLPNRRFIVITRDREFEVSKHDFVCNSIDEAMELVKEQEVENAYVIGGGEIYEMFAPYCDVVHSTTVHKELYGDVFAPNLDKLFTEKKFTRVFHQTYKSNIEFTYELFVKSDRL